MQRRFSIRPVLQKLGYSFPVQLLFLHLQRNWILIIFWLVLLAYITRFLGSEYGIPYLFLYPEYIGDVNVWAFGIMGISYGAFIMAFNISSYIINSARFPFLATLSRPFMKYCLNNFLLPGIVTLVYIIQIFRVLYFWEYTSLYVVFIYLASFLGGATLFMVLSMAYFFKLNKDVNRIFREPVPKDKGNSPKPIKSASVHTAPVGNFRRLRKKFRIIEEWRVDTYFQTPFKIALTRSSKHYDPVVVMRVFQQNHINAAVFEIFIFISLITFGLFREISFFKIPAGASFFLLFTMLLMLSSAVHFLMRRWSTLFFIGGFLFLNYLSTYHIFNVRNYAYGLDYSTNADYVPDSLQFELLQHAPFEADINHHIRILEKWKKKAHKSPGQKPYMVVIACSGGGLKASMWTFSVLQRLDSLSGGKLLDQTFLISGSSGGMIGSAYLRELYYLKEKGLIDSYYDDSLAQNTGKDLLNPVATTIALNDLFIRLQTFSEGTYEYPKDRGYAFEKQLNENTGYLMDRRLADYKVPEENAEIPLMIFSPTIINDGKRLLISPQPISFLCNNIPSNNPTYMASVEDIEFTRVFAGQNPYNLKFTSAIRMNATFPYILPTVSLPSKPSMEIVDAGVRDNYGVRTAVKYLYHMQDWIKENTAGVILIKIHDSRPVNYNKNHVRSIADDLLSPLGSILNNLSRVHLQENDQLLQFSSDWFDGRFRVIEFRLSESLKDKEISMSLHLTQREKNNIKTTLHSPRIEQSIHEFLLFMK